MKQKKNKNKNKRDNQITKGSVSVAQRLVTFFSLHTGNMRTVCIISLPVGT